jgi:hypothetical protein
MNTRRALTILLRSSLIIAAAGWGISLVAVLISDDRAFEYLSGMAGETVAGTAVLGYWLKMTGLAFTFIGYLFGYCAIFPFKNMGLSISLLAFNVLCGIALIGFGMSYQFDDHVYLSDGFFCLGTGLVGLCSLLWIRFSGIKIEA